MQDQESLAFQQAVEDLRRVIRETEAPIALGQTLAEARETPLYQFLAETSRAAAEQALRDFAALDLTDPTAVARAQQTIRFHVWNIAWIDVAIEEGGKASARLEEAKQNYTDITGG